MSLCLIINHVYGQAIKIYVFFNGFIYGISCSRFTFIYWAIFHLIYSSYWGFYRSFPLMTKPPKVGFYHLFHNRYYPIFLSNAFIFNLILFSVSTYLTEHPYVCYIELILLLVFYYSTFSPMRVFQKGKFTGLILKFLPIVRSQKWSTGTSKNFKKGIIRCFGKEFGKGDLMVRMRGNRCQLIGYTEVRNA